MLTPDMGNVVPAHGWWAMDNACFNHADTFDLDAFLVVAEKRLVVAGDRCLFIVAPDVPFDAEGTLRRFEAWGERCRDLGAPVVMATQNGMGVEDVPWNAIDGLFVGGNTRWKMGHESGALIQEARRRGQWVHMGRVNSLRRLRVAASMGCNSVDGTFLKYAPDHNWGRMLRWFNALDAQPGMVIA